MNPLPWVLAASLVLAEGPARPAIPGPVSPGDPGVNPPGILALGGTRLATFKNGLRLALQPDSLATAVDVAVWYDSGTRHERAGKTGIAHLFEHLMFRGSSHYGLGEHGRRVRAEGGTSGAYATADFTCFYQTLPPDALELAFKLEADRMTGLVLTQEGLDAERLQVGEERRRSDTPIGHGLDRLYSMAYSTHPYRWPLYGLDEDLGRLTLQDCRDFYRLHFGPGHALVTVAGNFRPDDALALAKKYFEPLEPTGKGVVVAPPAEKAQTSERRASERLEVPVRWLMAGWRVPARGDPDWPALSLLSAMLTRTRSARLARALVVDRALCLAIQGDVDGRKGGSLFYLALPLVRDADSLEVETRLFAELGRMMDEPPTPEELERAKRQTETAIWLSLQTSRGRGQALGGSMMLTAGPDDIARLLERVRACTAEDLQHAAHLLDPARRNVLWLLPTPDAVPVGTPAGRP